MPGDIVGNELGTNTWVGVFCVGGGGWRGCTPSPTGYPTVVAEVHLQIAAQGDHW